MASMDEVAKTLNQNSSNEEISEGVSEQKISNAYLLSQNKISQSILKSINDIKKKINSKEFLSKKDETDKNEDALNEISLKLEDLVETEEEKENENNGIKGIIGGAFKNAFGFLTGGISVKLTKANINDLSKTIVHTFAPLLAATSKVSESGEKFSLKERAKSAVTNKVGSALGKGIETLVPALYKFIIAWASPIKVGIALAIALTPPIVGAALILVLGMYFIVKMLLPIIKEVVDKINQYFPLVVDAIKTVAMSFSPFYAIVEIVKSTFGLIEKLVDYSMEILGAIGKITLSMIGASALSSLFGKDEEDMKISSLNNNIITAIKTSAARIIESISKIKIKKADIVPIKEEIPSNKNILLSQPALSLNTNLKETNSLLEKIYDRIDSFNVEKIIHNNYSSISNVKNVNTYDRMVQPFVNAVTKFDKAVGELIENLKSETVIKTVSTSINNSNNEQNSYKNYKNRTIISDGNFDPTKKIEKERISSITSKENSNKELTKALNEMTKTLNKIFDNTTVISKKIKDENGASGLFSFI